MNLFRNKNTERLRRMLEAIRTRDFTLQYNLDRLSGEEKRLASEINTVINEFRETELRQQEKYGYLDTLLEGVSTFLMVADEDGKVVWMNKAAIQGLCGFQIPDIQILSVLSPTFPAELRKLTPGIQKLFHVTLKETEVALSCTVTNYYRKGNSLRLYSMENIGAVLQQNELEAQTKLVRVLTHEMMNSLSPIISLSDTLCESWQQHEDVDQDEMLAIQAIHRRSQGLLRFIENYRRLSRLADPICDWVEIGDLLTGVSELFLHDYVHFKVENAQERVLVDRQQIEQVIINLIKNAMEACEEVDKPEVTVWTHADYTTRRFLICVEDNGMGILPDVMERIFIPFFTTKPQGSGIGLSLCRQIVNNHNGRLSVSSVPRRGSTFIIDLPISAKE